MEEAFLGKFNSKPHSKKTTLPQVNNQTRPIRKLGRTNVSMFLPRKSEVIPGQQEAAFCTCWTSEFVAAGISGDRGFGGHELS